MTVIFIIVSDFDKIEIFAIFLKLLRRWNKIDYPEMAMIASTWVMMGVKRDERLDWIVLQLKMSIEIWSFWNCRFSNKKCNSGWFSKVIHLLFWRSKFLVILLTTLILFCLWNWIKCEHSPLVFQVSSGKETARLRYHET